MGTVLRSTICHYCGGKATTEDHIVPRAALPKPLSRLPEWFRSRNVVPACRHCNNRKGADRSTCSCSECKGAWSAAIRCRFLVGHWKMREPVVVSRRKWEGYSRQQMPEHQAAPAALVEAAGAGWR